MESKLKVAAMDIAGEVPDYANLLLREGGYPHLNDTPQLSSNPLQLTDWISGDLKPVRNGIYQRDLNKIFGNSISIYYAYFIDGYWFSGNRILDDVITEYGRSQFQNAPWRGLKK